MPFALIPILVLMLFALPGERADAASWSSPSTITKSGAVQLNLAMGADGTAAVAYSDARGVQVAVRRAGHGWSSPHLVSGGRFTTTRPSVSVTGSGEVVVAWAQSGATVTRPSPTIGPLTIRAAIRSSRGSWGSTRQIGTSAHFLDAGVDTAANAHGDAIVVWRGVQALSNGHRTDAVQSSYRAAGGGFGGAQTVREGSTPTTVTGQVVALDGRGTAYAAWSRGSTPAVRLATRSRGGRGSWGTARTIGAAPSSRPVIAVTSDRTAVVAWHAAGLDSEGEGLQAGALVTGSRLPSGALPAPQKISDVPTRTYDLVTGPSGSALLTWVPQAEGSELRSTTRSTTSGQFAASVIAPGVHPGSFAGGPALLGDGSALLTWGESDHVRVVGGPVTGPLAGTPELDRPGMYPRIAAAGTRAVLAWNVAVGDGVSILASGRHP
jgi:hypothetical protein